MRKILSIICCVILIQGYAYSQEKPDIDSLMQLSFTLPDIPAFKALGADPSDILRPSTVSELGLIVSKFFNGDNFSLPSALAVEIAPFILMKDKTVSTNEYINRGFEKSFRISIGSFKDTADNSTNISVGFRCTLFDDFKDDVDTIRQKHIQGLRKINTNRNKYIDEYLTKNNLNESELEKSDVRNIASKYADDKLRDEINQFNNSLSEESNNNINIKYWNRTKLDLAMALLYNSMETPNKTTKFIRGNFWGTFATHFWDWDQLLLGAFFQINNQENYPVNWSIGLRWYAGVNILKSFLEMQYKNDKIGVALNRYFINTGIEFALSNSTWIVCNFGWEKDFDTKASSLISNIDFKYNMTEVLNLFKQ